MTVDLHTGPLGESAEYADGYARERLFPDAETGRS